MGNCCQISWDRRKSIWALRILSEVFLCTGIVACVAAFTIEQGKPNIYFLVSGFCLFLFAAIGLASSFCLSYDGKKADLHPVHTVTLPSAAGSVKPDTSIISAILASKANEHGQLNQIFNSMKSIPVDSVHSEASDIIYLFGHLIGSLRTPISSLILQMDRGHEELTEKHFDVSHFFH